MDTDRELLLSQRNPDLLRVRPRWEPDRELLTLSFPGGTVVSGTPEPGGEARTAMYDGRPVPGSFVDGPFAEALSSFLGRRVHLLRRAPGVVGADDHPVSLMSTGSLSALAPALGGSPDPRRFRMTITVDGLDPWVEHGWAGAELACGEALLRVVEPVPRCVVTTHNPDSGVRDAKVLHALAEVRNRVLTLGVWCSVRRPGTVRLGDPVTLA